MKQKAAAGTESQRDIIARSRKLIEKRQAAAALRELERLAARYPGCTTLAELKAALLSLLAGPAADRRFDGTAILVQSRGPIAFELLGRIHVAQGATDEARAAYEASLALQPVNVELQLRLGELLRGLDDLHGALACYRIAVKLAPKYVPALNNLAALLLDLDERAEAIPILELAYQLAPDAPPVLCNAARLERMAGRIEKAQAWYKRAVEIAPGHFDALIALADIAEHLSQLEAAHEFLKRAAAIFPHDGQLALISGRLARREGRYEQGVSTLEAALGQNLQIMLRADIHYLLGQLYERADAGAAYRHFEQANSIKLTQIRDGSKDDYLPVIASRRTAFQLQSAALASRPSRQAQRTPAFLVGFPRSGTTLLEQILDSHPRIQALPERPAADAMRRHLDERAKADPGARPLTEDVLQELEGAYYREVFRFFSLRPDRLLVDKMPLNLANADLILPVFPEARFILALRHPHDVVLSCFMQNFTLNLGMRSFLTLEGAADVYVEVMSFWSEVARALQANVHVIRYEDLLDDFEAETRRLLDFLGVGWDEAVRGHVEHARDRSIATPSYHQVTQPLYRTSRYRWQRYARQLEPVMAKLAPFVKQFGYAQPDLPA